MKYAVFLGAGASAAEGAPDQSHLFKEYFKSVREEPKHTEMERELITFFYKTSRKPQALKPGDEWCPERSQVKPGEAEQISI